MWRRRRRRWRPPSLSPSFSHSGYEWGPEPLAELHPFPSLSPPFTSFPSWSSMGGECMGKRQSVYAYVVGASRTVPLPMLVSSSACSYLHCVFPLSGYILVGRYYIRVNWICVGGKSSHYRYLYIQGSHSRQWLGLVNLELGSREKGLIWRLTASEQIVPKPTTLGG